MVLRFADCRLELRGRSLSRAGALVPIARRPFDVLLHLVRNRDRSISKDELSRVVWEAAAVSDEAIARAIADLRRAIGDDGKHQRLVRTVHGFGYRFVGSVFEEPVRATEETSPVAVLLGALRAATRQIESLPPARRAALRVMAFLGSTFDEEALLQVWGARRGALGMTIMEEALADALATGILEHEANLPGTYRFAHEVVRQLALYEERSAAANATIVTMRHA